MKRTTRVLTQDAQDDADDFYVRFADRGCTCFRSPPCSHCMHPGNPLNLECDDNAWIEEAPVTQSRNKREGFYIGNLRGSPQRSQLLKLSKFRAFRRGLAAKPGEAR